MLISAGAIFFSKNTNRLLLLMRNGAKFKHTWGLVGGKLEKDESVIDGLHREVVEEIGSLPDVQKTIPIEKFTSADGYFEYHTFVCVVENEFVPVLNHEHCGYCWCELGAWPKPLHPGVNTTLKLDVIVDKIRLINKLTAF